MKSHLPKIKKNDMVKSPYLEGANLIHHVRDKSKRI